MSAPSSSVGLAQLLAGLALLVAGGHLAYALTYASPSASSTPSGATAPTHAASPECRCDDAALRSEVDDLRRALRAVEQSAARGPATVGPAGPVQVEPLTPRPVVPMPPSDEELAIAVPGDTALPPIDMFIGIPAGVTLSQRANGTVEAKATQPERMGEEIFVHALTKGGEVKVIRARLE